MQFASNHWLRQTAVAGAWVMGLLLGGCAGFVPQPGPALDPPGRYLELTTPIVAVGDTQEHESTGYPLHDNDSAIDAYVEVAQRPPQQPLFGRRILEWALQRHPGEPFLHLGDLMDLSCRSEAERMAKVFRGVDVPGAVVPGNHDGLMFGIYSYPLDARLDRGAQRWHRACRRGADPDDTRYRTGSEALGKRDFIRLYLAEQAQRLQHAQGLAMPAPTGSSSWSWRNPQRGAFLSAIEARMVEGADYADSFVAQRLALPRAPGADRHVIVIALDTNQAGLLVSTWDTLRGRSPGSMGHVRVDQVAAVTPWVTEAIGRGDLVVFAGHHNWRSLGLPTRLLLRNLMSKLKHPLVYLSAHTHRGFWAVHTALDRRPLLELNVSSLSDWPIAYRRISFAYDAERNRLMVRGELRPRADTDPTSDAQLLAAWEAEACAAAGLEPQFLRQLDADVVQRQRDARGSLFRWLLGFGSDDCEDCQQPLFENGQQYQDVMLETVLQLADHLGHEAHRLYDTQLPAWCGDTDFIDCARGLLAQRPTTFATHVALFRRKATLVALLGGHLDDLRSPRAAAYMTCRAVQAAKIDFDATPDGRNSFRSEANRRAEQFFRFEATVGME